MSSVELARGVVALTRGPMLSYVTWRPERPPRALVLLHHGFGEHGARLDPLACTLAQAGFWVVAPDAQGHGLSSGRRGHIEHFDDYVTDFQALREHCLKELAEIGLETPPPVLLVGHSLGGLVALRLAMSHPEGLLGVAVTNPLFALVMRVPKWKQALGYVFSSFLPVLSLNNELKAEYMSRNPDVVEAYRTDPLISRVGSARWFTEWQDAAARTRVEAEKGLRVPVLFMLSPGDPVVDASTGREIFERLQTPKKRLHVFEHMLHEIFNEVGREDAFQVLIQWAEQELATTRDMP